MQNNKNKSTEAILSLNNRAPVIGITKEQTFECFFREYYTVLCFFAQSIIHNEEEAKDIVQDCFIKVWDNNTVTEKVESVKSFLYAMVRNRCIDYTRKQKMKTKAVIYMQPQEADEKYFDEIVFAETVRLVLECIEELPPSMKLIIKKYYLQSKRHKKIASELSSSENAIKMHKRRGLKLLKQKLLFFKR